jgi:hypothetical protein
LVRTTKNISSDIRKLLLWKAPIEVGGIAEKGAIYRCGELASAETAAKAVKPRNEFVTVPIYCWDKPLGNCIIFINFVAGS